MYACERNFGINTWDKINSIMITPKYFIDSLKANQIDFFTGVPDSLLKSICAYITDHSDLNNHIIAANEGAAVGLAAGYYLATGRIPLVYMQNSGIGNAVNPLVSLTDKEVYNIPLLLLIGWRGEPGLKDEPQHIKQGKITIPLLNSMGISNQVLSKNESELTCQLKETLACIETNREPFAFVIQKDTFEDYRPQTLENNGFTLSREEAIKIVSSSMPENAIIVSTTGMISRELFEYREFMNQNHGKDFLTVGSMGHASQISLGIALHKSGRMVYCFDGDGAILMHMGSLAIVGSTKPCNYVHVVFNNGAHDSVGGQPTVGLKINISEIAVACGYNLALSVSDLVSLEKALNTISNSIGPVLLEIKVKKGARKDLGRPTRTPIQNKDAFMNFLNQ